VKLARFVSRLIGEQPNILGNVSEHSDPPPTFHAHASCSAIAFGRVTPNDVSPVTNRRI